MAESTKANGHPEAAVHVAGWQAEATHQSKQAESNTDAAILKSRSTSTEAQRAKLLVLLRQSPKTTIELRDQGIMMPAARVFDLKAEGYVIASTLVTLYDSNGYRHSKCARYHLVSEAQAEVRHE